jgi:hypothetical protein
VLVAGHAAENVGQPGGDPDLQQHLDQVGQRRWVLVRMRRVGVEEAATVEDKDRY